MSQIDKDNIVYTIYNELIKTTNGSKSKPKRENKMNTLNLVEAGKWLSAMYDQGDYFAYEMMNVELRISLNSMMNAL